MDRVGLKNPGKSIRILSGKGLYRGLIGDI